MKTSKEEYPGQLRAKARVNREIYLKITGLLHSTKNVFERAKIMKTLEAQAAYMDKTGLSYVA